MPNSSIILSFWVELVDTCNSIDSTKKNQSKYKNAGLA